MRVRVNYTVELDPEQYREVFDTNLDKTQIRDEIQQRAMSDMVLQLVDAGLRVRCFGKNNAYTR